MSYRVFTVLFLLLASILPGGDAVAQNFGNDLVDTGAVDFLNRSQRALFVSFTVESGLPAPVAWSSNCPRHNKEVRIAPGQNCRASVPASAGVSRFCASEFPSPPGKAANCFEPSNKTVIETNFASGAGCYPTSQKSCIWYDIRVVPPNCTDCDWLKDNCKDSGGPAFNVPVRLSCAGGPAFTCRGPIGPVGPYGAQYPTQCGAPSAAPNCIGGLNAACLQAYFYPMSTSGACKYPTALPQPIGQCAQGQTLFVTFLDGN
jgi:hypothetical protein